MKADIDIKFNQTNAKVDKLVKGLDFTNDEFVKVLDIINSVLELTYLSQMLEFQDEIDRHFMSLWAL